MKNTLKNWKSSLLLVLASVIWGVAFVAQSVGMEHVGPFTFNGVRNLLGSLVLVPVIFFFSKKKENSENSESSKTLWIGGIVCGVFLCIASSLQQIGLQYTTVGKAGFLTAMYIVVVPIFGLFLKKKCSSFAGISILLAIIGLYLLSIKDGLHIGKGDTCVILCAVAFSLQILAVDYFAPKCDCIKLASIQFLVCGVISSVIALIKETPSVEGILVAWLPIAYAGVLSSGVAYTLQIVGQKEMNPTVASLIFSLESVVSVLAGWAILKQTLSTRELCGCVIMFVAIILAQLPEKNNK